MSYQRPSNAKGNNFLVILLLVAIAIIVAFAIAITTSKTDPTAIVNEEIKKHPSYNPDSVPVSSDTIAEPLADHTPPTTEPVSPSTPTTEEASTTTPTEAPQTTQAPATAETPKKEAEKETLKPTISASGNTTVAHEIKSGENLSLIAKKYNLKVSALKQANNLSSDVIAAGQKLSIPVTALHKVNAGETLSTIAEKYQVKADIIKKTNKLSSDAVQLNSELIIPLP